jgi:hypothetical protein
MDLNRGDKTTNGIVRINPYSICPFRGVGFSIIDTSIGITATGKKNSDNNGNQ